MLGARLFIFAGLSMCLTLAGCAAAHPSTPFDQRPNAHDDVAPLAASTLEALKQFEAGPATHYELGPGDVVDVTVWTHPELSGRHTVGPDGRIQIPYVGSLRISDNTPEQAGGFITRALSDDYVGPLATVQIVKYTDNQILVLGHVSQPGVLHFTDQPTLLEVLARAAGTAGDASLTRCAVFRGSDRMVWIDLRPLLRGQDTLLNIRLQRNDIVYVPSPSDQLVYVMGQVTKPGAYPLTPDMSFLQALSVAGGPTDAAQPKEIVLVRPDQHMQQIINFRDYLNGKSVQNYTLNRGDIVYVPKNGVAKFGWVLQQITPASSVMFGAALF
jgi:polysaccharide export outer membrane protein